jgi:predicted amidohydrolase
MRAAVFQFAVSEDPRRNLELVERALHEAAKERAELVVLPEMWPTSFPKLEVGEELYEATEHAWCRVGELSRELGQCVVGSGLGRTSGLPANRLRVIDCGEERLSYDKVHLFSPTAEDASFSEGHQPPSAVETSVGRLTGAVCYDLRFPALFEAPWREGFDLLAVSAQWPVPRIAHWRALVIGRAVERQCFVVACNRTGDEQIGRRELPLHFPGASMIVSPHGEVLAEGGAEASLIWADLDLSEARRYRTRIPLHKDVRPEAYGEPTRGCRDEVAPE